jgi:hypothetical protein
VSAWQAKLLAAALLLSMTQPDGCSATNPVDWYALT